MQKEIEDFLKSKEGDKFTSRELLYHFKKEGLDISLKSIQRNIQQLCKHNIISSESCIIRNRLGYENLSKIYWYDSCGLQITPIVHIEKMDR